MDCERALASSIAVVIAGLSTGVSRLVASRPTRARRRLAGGGGAAKRERGESSAFASDEDVDEDEWKARYRLDRRVRARRRDLEASERADVRERLQNDPNWTIGLPDGLEESGGLDLFRSVTFRVDTFRDLVSALIIAHKLDKGTNKILALVVDRIETAFKNEPKRNEGTVRSALGPGGDHDLSRLNPHLRARVASSGSVWAILLRFPSVLAELEPPTPNGPGRGEKRDAIEDVKRHPIRHRIGRAAADIWETMRGDVRVLPFSRAFLDLIANSADRRLYSLPGLRVTPSRETATGAGYDVLPDRFYMAHVFGAPGQAPAAWNVVHEYPGGLKLESSHRFSGATEPERKLFDYVLANPDEAINDWWSHTEYNHQQYPDGMGEADLLRISHPLTDSATPLVGQNYVYSILRAFDASDLLPHLSNTRCFMDAMAWRDPALAERVLEPREIRVRADYMKQSLKLFVEAYALKRMRLTFRLRTYEDAVDDLAAAPECVDKLPRILFRLHDLIKRIARHSDIDRYREQFWANPNLLDVVPPPEQPDLFDRPARRPPGPRPPDPPDFGERCEDFATGRRRVWVWAGSESEGESEDEPFDYNCDWFDDSKLVRPCREYRDFERASHGALVPGDGWELIKRFFFVSLDTP